MPIEIVDSHTHLDSKEFDIDRDAVIERAFARGVTQIITIGASRGFDSASRAIALAEGNDRIFASAGIHPHDAETPFDLDRLRVLAKHPRVVAIGETGFDFFKCLAPKEDQERWFRAQVELAREIKKPLIIHSREAGQESLSLLKASGASQVGGVFHCFSEDAAFAEKLTEINFLVSFPGTITFKKADLLREIVKAIPLSQIMVETDAPYMAPEPNRGKRCESSFVVDTLAALSTIKGVSFEEAARVTTNNAKRLFNLPSLA